VREVWKYNFIGTGQHDLSLPKGSSVLNFQIQDGEFTIWVLVDTTNPIEEADCNVWRFEIVGTGWETERRAFEYIGTAQDGPFVWHMFLVTVENARAGGFGE